MSDKITLSVIKADVGGYVGHSAMHEDLMEEARRRLGLAQQKGQLIDFHVTACGDDLELIMTHTKGVDALLELAQQMPEAGPWSKERQRYLPAAGQTPNDERKRIG